ncbi:helix-turn-helix domain-containing protein [Neobacillus citreus]|uniref:Helix-turn-helix domain-containing protein n=1 Tax=Neobacillus citreus TaxID=2833578 RepID=A0A942YB82_9BACI|nr:helix-turn-helix domain-containing protein [Neobacillus citreus]MCH6267294.1 helix-turn-helix domain-containing protein [Neobacillus citreus]
MFNRKFFELFLNQKGIAAPYQIWLTAPELPNFILIEGSGELTEQIPSCEHSQSIQDNKTCLSFNYPGNYQITVCLFQPLTINDADFQLIYHLLHPCYAHYALKASQYKIDKIVESIRHTTSVLDVEDLYSTILANTIDVIPHADLGTLWFYDPALNRYVCKASVGNVIPGIRKMRFGADEGFVGYAFKLRVPELFTNLSKLMDQDKWRTSDENSRHWDHRLAFPRNVKSMVTAPIMIDGRVECVMILCQIKTKMLLTEQDLQLLQGFTAQLGIAMRNARLFTNLKKQNELLVKRDDIHSTFTKLSLQNMGANRMIRELRRMIDLPIFFVDLIENESIPETKGLPDQKAYKELYNYLSSLGEKAPYDVVESEYGSHYLYPIRTGNVILGCLIIRARRQLNTLDQIALEQAHSILALELVKKQNLVEFYYKKKRELFNEILQIKDVELLQLKARELGIKENADLISVIFQFYDFAEPQVLEAHVHRLITQIKTELSPYIQTVFGYNNEVTLLAGIPKSSQFAVIKKKLTKLLVEWTKNNNIQLGAGMGSLYNGIHYIEKSYKEAKNALAYLKSRKLSGCIEYSEIGVNRLFINQNGEDLDRYVKDVFDPLSSNQGNNNILEQTLLTYFECNRSAAQTAKKLHVHINTLYHRLKKIEETLQISFESTENVLRLQLACYLRESFGRIES